MTLAPFLRLALAATTLLVLTGGSISYAQPKSPGPERLINAERAPKVDGSETRMSYSRSADSRVANALDRAEAARLASPPRYGEAEHAYRFVIYADPADVRAYFGLGNIYAAQKRNAEAVQAYRKAVEFQPNSDAAHFNLGLMYVRLNNQAEALKQAAILEKLKSPLAARLNKSIIR